MGDFQKVSKFKKVERKELKENVQMFEFTLGFAVRGKTLIRIIPKVVIIQTVAEATDSRRISKYYIRFYKGIDTIRYKDSGYTIFRRKSRKRKTIISCKFLENHCKVAGVTDPFSLKK